MKKINKKGFTLVELLAVIVILALLVVVLTPNALNAINSSRSNSFVSAYQSFVDKISLEFAETDGGDIACSDSPTTGTPTCHAKYGLSNDINATVTTDGTVTFKSADTGSFKSVNLARYGKYYTKVANVTTESACTNQGKGMVYWNKDKKACYKCNTDKIGKGATACTTKSIDGNISDVE